MTTNTWDFENRLIQVALPTGTVDTFAYNGDGQRVQKQDSSGTTKHVWDEQNIVLETDGSSIIQVVYTLEPALFGNLISQRRSGISSFCLFDALGSTKQLADSTGGATDSYQYDSFGNIISATGSSTNPFRFVGKQGYYLDTDLAGLYVRRRLYSPSAGEWLTRDTLVLTIGRSQYIYVGNNVTNLAIRAAYSQRELIRRPFVRRSARCDSTERAPQRRALYSSSLLLSDPKVPSLPLFRSCDRGYRRVILLHSPPRMEVTNGVQLCKRLSPGGRRGLSHRRVRRIRKRLRVPRSWNGLQRPR